MREGDNHPSTSRADALRRKKKHVSLSLLFFFLLLPKPYPFFFFLFKLLGPPACKNTFVQSSTPRRLLATRIGPPRFPPSHCPQECMIKPSFLSVFAGALHDHTLSLSCNTPLKTALGALQECARDSSSGGLEV